MYVIRRMSDELDDILKRYGTFEDLEDAILNYNEKVSSKNNSVNSNNKVFNEKLEKIVDDLFKWKEI